MCCFLPFLGKTHGAQDPMWGAYWNNQSLINPAMSGFAESKQAFVQGRRDFLYFYGAPVTIAFGYNQKFEKMNSGLGISYLYDKIGPFKFQATQLNYNYQWTIKGDHNFSVGLAANLLQAELEGISITGANMPNDNSLRLNAGLAYRYRGLEVGLSVNNINRPSLPDLRFKYLNHNYLYARYELGLNKNIALFPSVLLRNQQKNYVTDFNLNALLLSKYLVGVGYRTRFGNGSDLMFNASYVFKEKLSVGILIEYFATRLNYGNTYEFTLAYKLTSKKSKH